MLRLVGPLLLLSAVAQAETRVVRLASVAPAGTGWAHELQAVAEDVAAATEGRVKIKWYFGGIAGDDLQVGERIVRGQLDGAASAGILCSKLAPSMRVLRVLGVFQNRDEAAYVMGRLKPTLDDEFAASGFTNLVEVGIGSDVLFSREPVRSLDDLRRMPHWIWDLDDVMRLQLPLVGVKIVPLPLNQAAAGYDERRVDGFIAMPTAALAFQWSTQARYVSELYMGFLSGCLIVSTPTFDSLPIDARAAFRAAAAKLQRRVEEMGREQDAAILRGMYTRQGMQPVPVSAAFKADFFDQARQAREKLRDKLVPQALLSRVMSLLADYRAEYHN